MEDGGQSTPTPSFGHLRDGQALESREDKDGCLWNKAVMALFRLSWHSKIRGCLFLPLPYIEPWEEFKWCLADGKYQKREGAWSCPCPAPRSSVRMTILESPFSALIASGLPSLTGEAGGWQRRACCPWDQFVLSLCCFAREAWILLRPRPTLKRLKTPRWGGQWDEEDSMRSYSPAGKATRLQQRFPIACSLNNT